MDKNKQDRNIDIQIDLQCDMIPIQKQQIEDLVRFICDKFCVKNAVVNILIADDSKTTDINKQFLKHDKNTDVISFDLSDEFEKPLKRFDLIVNAQLAKKEAQKRQLSPIAELSLYITHGLLHNLGFDDDNKTNFEKMHKTEDDILQKLGLGIVYNTDVNI